MCLLVVFITMYWKPFSFRPSLCILHDTNIYYRLLGAQGDLFLKIIHDLYHMDSQSSVLPRNSPTLNKFVSSPINKTARTCHEYFSDVQRHV